MTTRYTYATKLTVVDAFGMPLQLGKNIRLLSETHVEARLIMSLQDGEKQVDL
jgi:hypothetical protein